METVPLCDSCHATADCIAAFRRFAELANLDVTLETSLKTIPGSVHLHLRKRGERAGTLEYTMDLNERRSWLSAHGNRQRPWVKEALIEISNAMSPAGMHDPPPRDCP